MKFILFSLPFLFICLEQSNEISSIDQIKIIEDYSNGIQAAKEANRPIFILFTGNCIHQKETRKAISSNPKVVSILNQKYITVVLNLDSKTKLNQVMEINHKGKKRVIKTKGQYHSHLMQELFKTNEFPMGVVIDAQEKIIKQPIFKTQLDKNLINYLY